LNFEATHGVDIAKPVRV
jgi:hypothetical protein